jgi:hypothetical protein
VSGGLGLFITAQLPLDTNDNACLLVEVPKGAGFDCSAPRILERLENS